MIEYVRSDIMQSDDDYMVIPVNCVGKPGKGLALQWAEQAPEQYVRSYINRCMHNDLLPGHIWIWEDSSFILATTKDKWWMPSQLEWIDSICSDLYYASISARWATLHAGEFTRKSIAVPKLGCRNGLLRWRDVKVIMEEWFERSAALFRVYI